MKRLSVLVLLLLCASLASAQVGVNSIGWVKLSSGGSTSPGGADTQIQFNDGGVFGGDAGCVFDKALNKLTCDLFVGALTGNVTGNVSGSSGSTTGNAATATALAADPADCAAGQVAIGITASGAAVCTADPTLSSVSFGADPADTGEVRLPNGGCIKSEASPAGTDMTLCSDTTEAWVSNSVFLSPAGGATNVSFGNSGNVATGMYFPGGNNVSISANGTASLNVTSSSVSLGSTTTFGWGGSKPTLSSLSTGQILLGFNNSQSTGSSITTGGTKALVDNTDVIYAKVTTSSGSNTGGTIFYSCEDTTTRGTISGNLNYVAVNVAGTITCAIQAAGVDPDQVSVGGSAGFACAAATTAFTCADAGSNILNLLAQAATTGGTDALQLKWTIIQNNIQIVTPQ